MGRFPASFCWTPVVSSRGAVAVLVACVGLVAGAACAAQTAHPNTLAGLNLGTVNVGSASATGTVTFTFDTGGSLDSTKPYQVVTQGALNLDFVNAAGTTCNGTTSYSANETCQVNVSFGPKYPGPRYGAVLLYGSAGNVIATSYVFGIGMGPLVTFSPGASSVVPGGASVYVGLAVDASGDVFILNNESTIVKNTLSGGDYVQSTIQLTDNPNPNAIASGITVDGAGNIFANFGGYGIEASPAGTGYTQSLVFGGLTNPDQITVDGSGNLYITERNPDKVIKAVRSATGYTHSPINTSIVGPGAIAVDGGGNVYVTGNGNVYMLTPSGGSYAQSMIVQASPEEGYGSGLAVDAAGDVYVSGSDGSPSGPNGAVFKATPSAGGFVLSTVLPDLDNPTLVELGENGNLYSTSSFDGRATQVEKVALAGPPSLTFAATANGSTSSDSPQTVTLTNIGNASLTFPVPESGDNPAISANFTLDSSGTGDCPLTPSGSSSPGTLASGTSCLLPISSEPESPAYGYVDGTLKVTDDSRNAAAPSYVSQTIQMTGRVPGAPPFGNLATPVDSVSGTNPVYQADSVLIKGWVADPVGHAPMNNVTVYIDGKSEGKPTMGYARPTVGETYGKADLDSGYQTLYPASSLAVGTHQVTVIAIDFGGNSTTFGPVSFIVATSPAK